MTDAGEIKEIIKEAFEQWEEADETDSIALFQKAIAGFSFALKNIEQVRDEYSPSFINSRMAWLHRDASFAVSKAAGNETDTSRALELYRERDRYRDRSRDFAREALNLDPDNFYAQRELALLAWFNSGSKGIGGWLTRGSLASELTNLVDIHGRVSYLDEFVDQAEMLFHFDKITVDDGMKLYSERKHLFETISNVDIDKLEYHREDTKAKEEVLAEAKKLQRQARVMLESL